VTTCNKDLQNWFRVVFHPIGAFRTGRALIVSSAKSSQAFPSPRVGASSFRIFFAFVWLLPCSIPALGAETKALRNTSPPIIRQVTPTSLELAIGLERTGRKLDAAAIYEQMVRTNSTARKVLSLRLVTIYAETGEANKALSWAHEVMRDNPDPQAYLAGVHERLGQRPQARAILEREIVGNTNRTRSVTLRWQLAEVCREAGDAEKAKRLLTEAAEAAKGTAMEPAAQRRLSALRKLANEVAKGPRK
jgi:tetratricopeptide (TPR) repeat protein